MITSKLGVFAQINANFQILNQDGSPADGIIRAGKTTVNGPWALFTKDQIARVCGIVTASMCNATDSSGNPVYEFQGNGWRPQGSVGDVLLHDANNPSDRWACKPDIFNQDSGWRGTVSEDGNITYAKPGKPILAMPIAAGQQVETLEGPIVSKEGEYLVVTNANKGDFFLWSAELIAKHVKPYQV